MAATNLSVWDYKIDYEVDFMKFTVIGAGGFIGNELYNFLKAKSCEVNKVLRNEVLPKNSCLGVVVYCAGYGDCKNDPSNVIDANLNFLKEITNNYSYKRLIYISSTRVYLGSDVSNEFSDLKILNSDNRKLFNLSKLSAEEICLKSSKDNVILRLSNVYGKAIKSPLFLPSIIRDSIKNGKVDMYVTPDYEKDYVFIGDVLDFIYNISNKDELVSSIYNVASGFNTKASDIAQLIESRTGALIRWHAVDSEDVFPLIDLKTIEKETSWKPRNVLDDVSEMIQLFEEEFLDAK